MKARAIIAAVSLVLLSLGLEHILFANSQSPPPGFRIYGAGTSSCGIWIRDKQRNNSGAGDLGYFQGVGWVDGFISGAGYASPAMTRTDSAGIEAFMDIYCQAHPLKTIADGATALLEELTKGR